MQQQQQQQQLQNLQKLQPQLNNNQQTSTTATTTTLTLAQPITDTSTHLLNNIAAATTTLLNQSSNLINNNNSNISSNQIVANTLASAFVGTTAVTTNAPSGGQFYGNNCNTELLSNGHGPKREVTYQQFSITTLLEIIGKINDSYIIYSCQHYQKQTLNLKKTKH